MKEYGVGLVPGPTIVEDDVRKVIDEAMRYGSGDLEEECSITYLLCQSALQRLFQSPEYSFVIMSGEAMVALWGALNSALAPGDKLLAISTGTSTIMSQ